MTLVVDRELVARTLAELVRINSVNPALERDGPGEAQIAGYVSTALRSAGLDVTAHEHAPGRVSVVARLDGKPGGRSLMLNAHLDTVGVVGMPDPFSGAVRDGKLYGRGSYDMKGSLAACVGAAAALARAGAPFRGSLLVAAVADEENASMGTADLVSRYPVDGAIVTEPTHLEVCLAHKGFAWIDVVTHGRAAHGSRPDLGVDANLAMGRFLARLADLERELRERPAHRLVGPPSLHAGLLSGGSAPSVYAAECRLTIERRMVPGETVSQVSQEIASIVSDLAAEDPTFQARFQVSLSRPAFEVSRGATIVGAVARALEAQTGQPARFGGQTPWMDSALLAEAGVDTVVFGPSGAGAHAAEEWVDLESVMQVGNVLAAAAVDFCA